ncbi:HsdM family class I SAM-dependent methyltransferase [Brevibacterium oceani]|uniref:HsdM family class I SAM-dependent methyltransferase n=1 Tax=Brevibacterium oceani TaxID=358099 RepID=UPI0015E7A97E|nr:N-6 DNA methylase [Brevibacterium oceani]
MKKSTRVSEYRSYSWIKEQLKNKGWNPANPNVESRGQVWEQNEAQSHPELAKGLGAQKPEFVARITDISFWVIEAKQSGEIGNAIDEAQMYADNINTGSTIVQARLATGVAGDDQSGYVIRTKYLNSSGQWEKVTADDQVYGELLTNREALRIIAADSANLSDIPLTVAEVVEIGKYINSKFHSAKVTKERRALIVASLLLALERDPSLSYRNSDSVFIADVNSRAREAFAYAGKEDLWDRLGVLPEGDGSDKIAVVLSEILIKLKFHDLLNTARSTDLLGSFFESFLRYGNTSKDLGIVLTPRHLCWLAAEAVGVTKYDVVYDPAVGTGGFLVAAFNRVTESATPMERDEFASNGVFGVEQSDHVAALAFVNMYFRGDGKHNLKIDSSLGLRLNLTDGYEKLSFKEGKTIQDDEFPAVTKVLMNPPFSLPDANEAEIFFVDAGLRQLVRNGLLFAVLPASVLYDSQYSAWREELLEQNTLLSVIALPTDLFYPVATETVGVVLRKGIQHGRQNSVLWIRLTDDGFKKKKGYRVERYGIGYKEFLSPVAAALRRWVQSGIETLETAGRLEFRPLEHAEWLPQAHLGTGILLDEDFEWQVRETYRQMLTQQLQVPFEAANDHSHDDVFGGER